MHCKNLPMSIFYFNNYCKATQSEVVTAKRKKVALFLMYSGVGYMGMQRYVQQFLFIVQSYLFTLM